MSAESLSGEQALRLRKSIQPKPLPLRSRLKELIQKEAIFRHVDSRNLDDVVDSMVERQITNGETVICQGQYGDGSQITIFFASFMSFSQLPTL